MTPPPSFRVVPSHSEAEILALGFGCSVDEISPDSLTGVDIEALARSACLALGLESGCGEVEVTFYRRGTFNVLYRLHFTGGGDVDVLARIPTSAYREHGGASVSSTVANMHFAQHVCNIPVPRIIAWNDGSDQSQVPYIITDLVQDAYEVWPAWLHEPRERKERVFGSFARTQAAFMRPLRDFPPSSIGCLSLKRSGGTTGASAGDYVLEPLTVRHPNATSTRRPKEPLIHLHSVLLRDVWFELLEWHSSRCLQHSWHLPDNLNAQGQEEVITDWNRETLPDPEDIIAAPRNDFLAVVDDLRSLVTRTLNALEQHPSFNFMQPCLVRTDYAFRNTLLDPNTPTLDTKACVDFDDVQICPLVLAPLIPQDLLECEEWNIPHDHAFFTQEGGFSEFPLDEYGPEDLCPEKTEMDEDADERLASNNRIQYTTYRSSYLAALEKADPRINDGWWELHKDARKVHELLVDGTHMWWLKREWLRMRRGNTTNM